MTLFSYTFLAVLAVDLLATSGDITLSWTSPIYPKLYSNDTNINPLSIPITVEEDAWIGSLLSFGAIIGPVLFGFIAETFGRKIGLLSIAIPHIISYLTLSFAKNIYLFYFARFLGGLALGGGYNLLPMYIAEISQDANRGAMTLTLNVFWAIGNFLPYATGPFMSIFWFNLILSYIPTFFFIIFILIGPETPYYLVSKNEMVKAEKSLMLLRSLNKEAVQEELCSIQSHLKLNECGHFFDILRTKALRKAYLICIILISTQELGGFCAIMFHLQSIFEAAGTNIPSDISALIVGVAMLVSSFIAPFFVDSAGRKILLILSCFGMFIAQTMLGLFFYIQDCTSLSTKPIFWIPIFSLILYLIAFNAGICSVPWTLSSELFPNNVKQVAAASLSSVCWLSSFVMTSLFNYMNDVMGNAGTFWFFATVCLASGIFSIYFVPETKGKSFSEIQEMLQPGYVKKDKFNKNTK